MATPLHKLEFHIGPDPITNDDDCKVSPEVMEMGNYLQDQYGFAYTSILSKSVEFSASSLIPLFITGKNNNVPNLVSILWDIYCQWKLLKTCEYIKDPNNLETPRNYSFEYFLLCSPLGENVDFSAKNMKLLTRGMNEYYFNYFWPITRSSISLINDSFTSYTKYAISISQSVNAIIGKNSDLFPLHLDFWIIPKCIMIKQEEMNENNNNKNNKNDKKITYREQEDDVIMNIPKRLNLGNIEFSKATIKNGKDMSSIGISQLFSRKIVEILRNKKDDNDEKLSHRRIMTVIDRRNTFYDFTVHETKENDVLKRNDPPLIECDRNKKKTRNINEQIYFYEVNNKYGVIPNNYIQERLLYNTQQWLLPFCRIKTDKNINELDGGTNYLWKNQVFLLSFHINSNRDVKVYWHLNGDIMRFIPNNMTDIWPNYFYKINKKELEKFNDDKIIKKEWKLKITEKIFQQYYRELIPKKK